MIGTASELLGEMEALRNPDGWENPLPCTGAMPKLRDSTVERPPNGFPRASRFRGFP